MSIYVTYLTIYSGNKLPPFYIGSTSLDNVNSGYNGTVRSKKYKSIWKEELRNNPDLFKTKIISQHNDRKSALEKELILQQKLNVVKSPMYINMSLACPNGYFGMSTKGILKSEDTKKRMSISMKGNDNARGIIRSNETRNKIRQSKTGVPLSESHKKSMSESRSLEWIIIDPDGNQFKIINLKQFCRDNNLDSGAMSNVSRGINPHHKKWKCINPRRIEIKPQDTA